MTDRTLSIALAAWNQYQILAQNASNTTWKVRAAFYAVSVALFATGYSSGDGLTYLCAPVVAALFLLLESGYKRLEMQYIRKSLEIERTLTDLLVDEPTPYLPTEGISTSLSTPTVRDLGALFALKRFLFWAPYLAVGLAGVVLAALGVTGER